MHFNIFTRIKNAHRSHITAAKVSFEKERLVNKVLTCWVLLNGKNKRSPFVKSTFSQFVCVSLGPPVSHHRLSCPLITPSLFLCSPLVLWQEFWCCPSDLTQAKQTAEKMPLFFSSQFSSHFNPFYSCSTFSSNHPSHLRLYRLLLLGLTGFQ